ncbi:hypothetical protein B0H13DRAFT_1900430 [Mycena leptocephala]|nr:hypothetical protein B0H13DRAFT_1900430 [Mycena leptocephala]
MAYISFLPLLARVSLVCRLLASTRSEAMQFVDTPQMQRIRGHALASPSSSRISEALAFHTHCSCSPPPAQPIFDHGSRTRFLLGDAAFDLVDLPFHHQLPDRFASPSHLPLLPPLAQSAGAIEEVEAVDAVKTGAGKAEMVAAICICMEETFTEAFTKKKALSAAFVAAPDAYLGSPSSKI